MGRAAAVAAAVLVAAGCGSHARVPAARHLVYLHYVSGVGSTELWIADGDGRHARRLIRPASNGFVSPDGRRVAFGRRDGSDLWMVNSDGSHARLLAARTNVLGWIRNDRLLALHRGALVAVDADSGALTTLDADTHAGSTGLQGWDLAPDGSSIAYGRESSTQLGAYCGPGADIWVVPVDGGRPRRVTTNHRSRFPVWGGRFIAFRRDPRGCFAAEIWKVRPDGSQLANLSGRPPKRFSQFGYYGYAPFAWLSADKLLIGLVNEWGDEAAILGPGRRVRRLKWYVDDVSRDGRWFVGTNGGAEGPYDIAIVEVGRGRARVVAHGAFCCPDWNR